ncbi:MAG: FliA/WhiG family RNA polymerase sigma factor [Candidatus Wallbacteria bacterium]|nr:FliA/WhiG family RNA polymerase sigma factor [Candidatus Wallbacteria bacterium]MBI4867919.1 FliA/WhiG family RNA polymerase sigma factor [Candidatus Wallbacteria bacterium]
MEEAVRNSAEEEDYQLWSKYKTTGNPAIRERLIVKYSSFVKYVAGRMAVNLPSSVEYDDLVGYGVFGLIDAIDKYDPDRKIKFKTYAKTRIRGAILDELRMLDWTPRSVRQKSKNLERAIDELGAKLGRPPEDAELAEHLEIGVDELHHMLDETRVGMLSSLDEGDPDGEGGVTRLDFIEDKANITPQSNAEKVEMARILAREMTTLSDRERQVLSLYYFEELTSKEIGRILGVSDSRVSQLHTKAILRLRGRLSREQDVLMA